MNKEKILDMRVFQLLEKADSTIWQAVTLIEGGDNDYLKAWTKKLMRLRGEITVEFLMKFYNKYPELDVKKNLDDETKQEMENMFDSMFKKD